MILKATLKEMSRLKSNCSVTSSIYALLMVHCLSLFFRHGYACAPNPETSNANMRYPKPLTPSPNVAMILTEPTIGKD